MSKLIKLEALDWRYSASICGLCKYLEYYDAYYDLTEDYIEFTEDDVTEEKYLKFVENYFADEMHHIQIEKEIDSKYDDEKSESERIKKINEKMNANTILKKIFSKIKYSSDTSDEIKKLINENRNEIIKTTYRGGRKLYYNFCNEGKLFEEKGKVCRINGYYLDMGKKSKSASYKQDTKTFVFGDSKYFDFIPFAFSKDRESFFINYNLNLKNLIKINNIKFRSDERNLLRSEILLNLKNSANKIEYNTEIIIKNRENSYFETLYLRREAINILEQITDIMRTTLKYPCHLGKSSSFSSGEYIPVEKIVTNRILNIAYLDDFIEFLFKQKDKKFLNSILIQINRLIYKEEENMTQSNNENNSLEKSNYTKDDLDFFFAQKDAEAIRGILSSKSNKLRTYEQKLITAISLKDYDKVKEILLHLSSYTQLQIRALVPLFKDFEKNKNLAYTFINALGDNNNNFDKKNNNKGDEK